MDKEHDNDIYYLINNFEVSCPFCGKVHWRRHPLLNAICSCGAKYYAIGEFWLNRKTGETIKE